MTPRAQLTSVADAFLDAVLGGQQGKALGLIDEVLKMGTPVSSIYLDILQPTQRRVGDMWETGAGSVAVEHYCTGVTQRLMARLFPSFMSDGSAQRVVVGVCVEGELHDLGLRMVCDFFEMENWVSHFLGTGMPAGDVISFLGTHSPDLVCISCSTPYNIHKSKWLIDRIRREFGQACPKLLVGGRPFISIPDLAEQVGADGSAFDARHAVEVGTTLVGLKDADTYVLS